MKLRDCWIFIPIIPFFAQVFTCMENVPTMDDFDMPLNFVMNFAKTDFWHKLGLIFGQYGEHRLVPSKLLYIFYFYLTGGINFRILAIIGDMQLVVVAFVSVYFIRRFITKYWQLVSFVWVLCIFDLNTYENACMTMNAVGNYGVIMLFFASLYFYSRSDKALPLAVLFQFLCIFSNGNGLPGSIFLVLYALSTGEKKKVWVSAGATILFVSLYFINYKTITLPNKLPFDVNRLAEYFVRQAGAHFSFDGSGMAGFLVLVVMAFTFPYKLIMDKKLRPILCMWAFVTSTMALAAMFRSGYADAQFQTSRYLIYPQIMIACLVLFVFIRFKNRNQLMGLCIITILMYVNYTGNYSFGKLGFERTQYRMLTRKYWYPVPLYQHCDSIVKEASDEGVYFIDENR